MLMVKLVSQRMLTNHIAVVPVRDEHLPGCEISSYWLHQEQTNLLLITYMYAHCIVAKFMRGETRTKQKIDIMCAKFYGACPLSWRPHPLSGDYELSCPLNVEIYRTKIRQYTEFMLVPHLHLCNRAGFQDNAAKSDKPGHRTKFRDCPSQTTTLGNYDIVYPLAGPDIQVCYQGYISVAVGTGKQGTVTELCTRIHHSIKLQQ